MKSLLVITPKVNINDDLNASFVGWLKEFAKWFDRVEVICLSKGEYDLPANVFVHSLGKERNNSRLARALNFYKLLFRLAPQSVGIFASYSPIYALASWPAAFIFHKKIILWYLHRSVTLRLKLAEKICFKIVTADKESLRLKSPKIIELGHGVDLEYFKQEKNWQETQETLNIISVGRISKIKNFETLIKAGKILKNEGLLFKVKVIGRPIMENDASYLEELQALVSKLDLNKYIEFVGFVPYSRITPYYKEADLLINALPDGGIDRTVLEGMASGLLILTSNRVFEKYFGSYAQDLIFDYKNPDDLAIKIKKLAGLSIDKKQEVSRFLSDAVAKHHDKRTLVEKISRLYK